MSRVETLVSFFGDRAPKLGATAATAAQLTPEQLALVAEACAKSGVVWVRPLAEERSRVAWHCWHADAVHLISGVGEQVLPLLDGPVEVIAPSKDAGGRLVTFLALAQVLAPRSPEWEAAATALSAVRLNTPDPADQHRRWANGCVLSRLVPVHPVAQGAGPADAPSEAATRAESNWTTTTRRPWHLGGRARRARRLAAAAGQGSAAGQPAVESPPA